MNYKLLSALVAIPLLLGSCSSVKKNQRDTTQQPEPLKGDTTLLQQVNNNSQRPEYVVSKVKFTVEKGVQEITLTGNFRMHRNDVIQLQLMAFGMVEAARIELTKDYVLIMDRINKQYLKATYREIDFLRNQGINFFTLQSLFAGELFLPGKESLKSSDLTQLESEDTGEDCVIRYEQEHMFYSWLADTATKQIKMANITFRSITAGNTQLNWDYQNYYSSKQLVFPSRHKVVFSTADQKVTVGINLNYLKRDAGWNTRTKVSDKYRKVTVDQMLRRFMALG